MLHFCMKDDVSCLQILVRMCSHYYLFDYAQRWDCRHMLVQYSCKEDPDNCNGSGVGADILDVSISVRACVKFDFSTACEILSFCYCSYPTQWEVKLVDWHGFATGLNAGSLGFWDLWRQGRFTFRKPRSLHHAMRFLSMTRQSNSSLCYRAGACCIELVSPS